MCAAIARNLIVARGAAHCQGVNDVSPTGRGKGTGEGSRLPSGPIEWFRLLAFLVCVGWMIWSPFSFHVGKRTLGWGNHWTMKGWSMMPRD